MKLCVILLVGAFALQTSSKIDEFVEENVQRPIVTETPAGIHVTLGEREPRIFSNVVPDCKLVSYPNNGSDYENNEDIVLIVEAETPGPRQLIVAKLNLQVDHDYITIFVWRNNQFERVTRYSSWASGSSQDPIDVPHGRALIHFTSDESGTAPGFAVFFTAPESSAESNLRNNCGTLSHPHNLGYYGLNEDVVYLIDPVTPGPTEIAFTFFEVNWLGTDFVRVFVWQNNEFELVGAYHGSNLPPAVITVPRGRALISFVSTGRYVDRGFRAAWYNA